MANFKERFIAYKASKKTLFWSCAGAAVLTMIVGFSWGGWVTGGTAVDRAQDAAHEAVAELAASICVNKFVNTPNAHANLAALKDESSYSRDNFIKDGGWATLASQDNPIDGAAQICANQLAEMDASALPEIPVADSGISGSPATAVN